MNVVSYVGALAKPACAPIFLGSEDDPEDYKEYGFYLEDKVPGYRTVSVEGRESHSTDLKTDTNNTMVGDIWLGTKLNSRTITVNFAITTDTKAQLLRSYGTLRSVCSNLMYDMYRVIFHDDEAYYYEGHLTDVTMDEIDGSGSGVYAGNGSLTIYCEKPMKYSVKEYVASSDSNGFIRVSYDGTYPSYPRFELTNSENNGAIIISDQYSDVLLFGEVHNLQGEVEGGQLIIDHDFQKEQSAGKSFAFDQADAATSTYYDSIGISLDGQKLAYGTGGDLNNELYSLYLPKKVGKIGKNPWSGSGNIWSVKDCVNVTPSETETKVFINKDFDLEFGTTLLINNHSQNGGHLLQVLNEDKKPIMGMLWYLNSLDDTIHCRYLIGNTYIGEQQLIGHADNGGKNWERNGYHAKHRMQKRGDKLTWHYYQPYTVTLRPKDQQWLIDSKGAYIQYVQFGLETGNFPLPAIRCLRYIKYSTVYSHAFTTSQRFKANSNITIDTKNATAYMDGFSITDIGAVGNDWEAFCLRPGEVNGYGFSVSPWSKSKISGKMYYRNVMI